MSMNASGYHVPVMLEEAIAGLNITPRGIYVDCTMGGGGHTRAILERLDNNGRLIAFDQDEDAARNVPDDKRVLFIRQNFRHLRRFLRVEGIEKVDGILADLGVSSFQFDTAERGFSTRFEGDADMRMDRRQEKTAATVLNGFSQDQLHKLFERYGEISNSKTLAATIVESRKAKPFKKLGDLKSGIAQVVKGNPNKYFAQLYQALRIEVNEEMQALEEMLIQSKELLAAGGRLVIITFHSLEDRLVKNFIRAGSFNEEEHDLFGKKSEAMFKAIAKKPVTASEAELKLNPRSRSAKLRIAEKL